MIKRWGQIFVLTGLLTTGCLGGESSLAWKEEIATYEVQVKTWIDTITKRLKACETSDETALAYKSFWKPSQMEGFWLKPVQDYSIKTNLAKEDYAGFGLVKKGVDKYADDMFKVLDKAGC